MARVFKKQRPQIKKRTTNLISAGLAEVEFVQHERSQEEIMREMIQENGVFSTEVYFEELSPLKKLEPEQTTSPQIIKQPQFEIDKLDKHLRELFDSTLPVLSNYREKNFNTIYRRGAKVA